MHKNNLILIYLVIMVVWLLAGGSAYASAPVAISAETGFAGKCKAGGINPVRVTLESGGQDVEGTVTVAAGARLYRHRVDLPAGTTKMLPFSVLVLNQDRAITISFDDHDGKVIAGRRVPLEIAPANAVLVGLLSDTPAELYYVRGLNAPLTAGKDVLTVNMDENFHFTPAEMQNINLIVLDNFNTGNLAADQEELLRSWLSGGGLALVGTGRYGYKNLTGMFARLDGAEPTGYGCAAALPFSPAGSDDPSGVAQALEQYITAAGLARLINGARITEQAAAAGELQPVAERLLQPSGYAVLFLLALAVVYLLLLGACIFWRGRPWWAVPAIVAGFAMIFCLLAWSGGLYRSKAVCAGVQIHGDDDASYSLTNIYPYRQQQLEVQLPGTYLIQEAGAGKFSIDPLETTIAYDDAGPHYLYSRGTAPGKNPNLQLGLDGDLLTGEIENPLACDLVNCFLLVGDTVVGLGDLEGRGRVEFKYRLEHALLNLGDYNFLDAVSRAGKMDNYQLELFKYYFYQAAGDGTGCKMFGFSRGQKELTINGKSRKVEELALRVFPVTLQTGPGAVTLPPGLVQPVVECRNPSTVIKNDYNLREGEELTVYYVLPPEVRAGEISVYSRVEGGQIKLEVFNRRQGAWEPLISGMLQGAALEDYIGGGPLAIKIKGSGRIIIPQIGIKGYKSAERAPASG
ncbi:hypothetical protein SAMN05660649_02047 [Desulfotomaculum arcticum]|uniref:Uncharacterized protein n=1 Tax=Desulfotruncus arcticus DSM 17038 TaxID=1121424 RepID=A0A1I2SWV5_9FIRM|nr:hypothetical protein [Desulfotruncus arcticus]SFG57192.1 hypothetical protein SAMN05660649_02047 [Desulfotomaculum arcticum] [Desulfotruncus arcticus DSM 17038]